MSDNKKAETVALTDDEMLEITGGATGYLNGVQWTTSNCGQKYKIRSVVGVEDKEGKYIVLGVSMKSPYRYWLFKVNFGPLPELIDEELLKTENS